MPFSIRGGGVLDILNTLVGQFHQANTSWHRLVLLKEFASALPGGAVMLTPGGGVVNRCVEELYLVLKLLAFPVDGNLGA